MLTNLHYLGLPNEKRKVTLVSDKWRGTIAAIKQYRQDKGWAERDLPHELVDHDAGEIVNSNGYTTNGIEACWSVLKRWVRKVKGGRMPTHSDRDAWRLLIAEFQYRRYASRGNSLDGGNTFVVPVPHFLKVLGDNFVR